jgi:hypothetical protein
MSKLFCGRIRFMMYNFKPQQKIRKVNGIIHGSRKQKFYYYADIYSHLEIELPGFEILLVLLFLVLPSSVLIDDSKIMVCSIRITSNFVGRF